MKKAAWSVLFFSSLAFAETSKFGLEYNFANPYDVVVPALNGDPSGADRQVGQLFLDVSSGAGDAGTLKAVGKDGSLLSISNAAGNTVVSSGNERVERVVFGGATAATACTSSPCTIHSQSGSWVSSVTRSGTGIYSVNFVSGTFSSAPTCIFTSIARVDSLVTYGNVAPTISNFQVQSVTSSTGSAGLDTSVAIVCMGPQ